VKIVTKKLHSKNKGRKLANNAEKQFMLRKDQKKLLEYYDALSGKDRKDVSKFMRMISGLHLKIIEKKRR